MSKLQQQIVWLGYLTWFHLACGVQTQFPKEDSSLSGFSSHDTVGRERVRTQSPDGQSETCLLPTRIPGFKYSSKDEEKEDALCKINFYAKENSVVGLCPKIKSTNPGIDILDPKNKTTGNLDAKSTVESDSNCKLANRPYKKIASFKQSWGDQLDTIAWATGPLGYYHVARALGDIGNVAPAVLRSMSLSQHKKIAERGTRLARGTVLKTWQYVADQDKNPASLYTKKEVYTADFQQIFGALVGKVADSEVFSAFDSGSNSPAKLIGSQAFKNLVDQRPLHQLMAASLSSAPALVSMKNVAELLLMDYLFGQVDRFSGSNIETRKMFYWVNEGKLETTKFENAAKIPSDVAKVIVNEMILSDNDAVWYASSSIGLNHIKQIRHLSPDLYKRLESLESAFNNGTLLQDFFSKQAGFNEKNLSFLGARLKNLRAALAENRASGKLALDLSLNQLLKLESNIPSENLPSQGLAIAKVDTKLKIKTIGSELLAESEKCSVSSSDVIAFTAKEDAAGNHVKIILKNSLAGCSEAFNQGRTVYVYRPHFDFRVQ